MTLKLVNCSRLGQLVSIVAISLSYIGPESSFGFPPMVWRSYAYVIGLVFFMICTVIIFALRSIDRFLISVLDLLISLALCLIVVVTLWWYC